MLKRRYGYWRRRRRRSSRTAATAPFHSGVLVALAASVLLRERDRGAVAAAAECELTPDVAPISAYLYEYEVPSKCNNRNTSKHSLTVLPGWTGEACFSKM